MSEGPEPAKPPERLPARVYFTGMMAGAVAGGLYLLVSAASAGQRDSLVSATVSGSFLGVLLGTISGPMAAWVVRQQRARGMAARLVLGAFAGLMSGAALTIVLSGALGLVLSPFMNPQGPLMEWPLQWGTQNLPRGALIGLIAGAGAVCLDRPAQPEPKDGPST
jgi:hypothetical protein